MPRFNRGIPSPYFVFVLSLRTYFCPALGGGGKGSSLTTVLSTPVFPPFGPTMPYCPEAGARVPGDRGLVFGAIRFTSKKIIPHSAATGRYGCRREAFASRPALW